VRKRSLLAWPGGGGLAGRDGPGRRALPVGELLQPLPLAAVALLAANDWLLKGGALPGWLTGKLSDLAGLLFAPLLATALWDLAMLALARLGAPVDFSLRRWKLAVAIAAVGAVFAAAKLSPAGAAAIGAAWSRLWPGARLVADPTDLLALPALAAAWWLGRREIARVPLGRLEVLQRAWHRARIASDETGARHLIAGLADVERCGGEAAAVAALARGLAGYFEGGTAAEAEAALERLRGVRSSPESRAAPGGRP
jgi:hypothetical protein